MGLIWSLVIGAVAGFLAGKLMKGSGFGLLGNLIVGVIGGLVGGLVFGILGFKATHTLGRLISATVGAVVFLAVLRALSKKR